MAKKKDNNQEQKPVKIKRKFNIEFSKVITTFVIGVFIYLSIWSITEYYTLVQMAIENESSVTPDVSLPVTCITVILGAILSYCLYKGVLKHSLNKNKLTIDKATGVVKSLMDNDLYGAVENVTEDDEE